MDPASHLLQLLFVVETISALECTHRTLSTLGYAACRTSLLLPALLYILRPQLSQVLLVQFLPLVLPGGPQFRFPVFQCEPEPRIDELYSRAPVCSECFCNFFFSRLVPTLFCIPPGLLAQPNYQCRYLCTHAWLSALKSFRHIFEWQISMLRRRLRAYQGR